MRIPRKIEEDLENEEILGKKWYIIGYKERDPLFYHTEPLYYGKEA
jgi:hypothetical protein